jgi:hypothetical protein
MAYVSNGDYTLISDRLVRDMLSIMAQVDPDILDDIANEMIDKLAVVISREIESSYARGAKDENESQRD